jgi:hypothetical protein
MIFKVQDVPTRWGSTLTMITRLLQHKEAVITNLSQHKHNLNLPSDAEWSKLEAFKQQLSPCEKASELLGGQCYVTNSVVLPIVCFLKKEMCATDDDPGYIKKFKEGVWADLVSRMDKVSDNAYFQVATALDIRFKNLKSIEKSKRATVWRLIKNLMKEFNSQKSEIPSSKKLKYDHCFVLESDSDSENEHNSEPLADSLSLEFNLYCAVPTNPDISVNPLNFWSLNEHSYPLLSKLAKQYLSIPASSVTVERLFSSAGDLISKKRNAIDPNNANVLLCLYS